MLFYVIYDEYAERRGNSLGYTVTVACVIGSYVAKKQLLSHIDLIIECIRISLILPASTPFIMSHNYMQVSLTKFFSI